MKWEDVLKRDDIVGGEIEMPEDGDIYRGPIKSIGLRDEVVDIRLEWCAKMRGPGKTGFGQWRVYYLLTCVSVNSEILPRETSGNRLVVIVPGLGVWIIFPKGGSKLDPAKVSGLPITKLSKESK